ncbi:hypothetical protein PMIN03_011486 [Paraphaeosphaeria minitans]
MTRAIRREALQQINDKTPSHRWHPDSLTGITASARGDVVQATGGPEEAVFAAKMPEKVWSPASAEEAWKRSASISKNRPTAHVHRSLIVSLMILIHREGSLFPSPTTQ